MRQTPGLELAADVGMADAYRMQNRFFEAISLYASALVEVPVWDKVAESLAVCLEQTQQLGDLLALCNQQIALGGEQEGRWRNRRVVLATHLNLLDLAISDNQWLHAAEPGQLQYQENLGFLLEQVGEYTAAEPHVAAVLAAQPGNVEMSLYRIREALRQGDDALAADRLDGLGKQPMSEGQHRLADNYRGRVADRRGDTRRRSITSLRRSAACPASARRWPMFGCAGPLAGCARPVRRGKQLQ